MKCNKYLVCYFPKDILEGKHGIKGLEKHIHSCINEGEDCDMTNLSYEKFKVIAPFDEFCWYFRGKEVKEK